MDNDKLHDIIIRELVRIREKLDDQHKRIDNIAQELVRIDTTIKTGNSMNDSMEASRQWAWEKWLGVFGAIGLAVGLIVGFI